MYSCTIGRFCQSNCFGAGKFNLGKLYEKIGFNKEIISRGRYAELTAAEQRPFRLVFVLLFGEFLYVN